MNSKHLSEFDAFDEKRAIACIRVQNLAEFIWLP